eukprot:s1119_g2.t1
MARTEGDVNPKWLIPHDHVQAAPGSSPVLAGSGLPSEKSSAAVAHGSLPVMAGSDLPSAAEKKEGANDATWLEELMQELERKTQGAFQDAHNQGFYINDYTTKVHALGDKLMQGLQRIAHKIHAVEAEGSARQLTTRQQNRERIKTVLKKLVHLMNSLQVKSGSELVFPMLFDHMSFATHRCWEINVKVAFAKTLSAWQDHFKGSLKVLHERASVSQRLGFILPSLQAGRARELPTGWLMQLNRGRASDSANAAATLGQELPVYIYNMWVYGHRKQSSRDPLGDYVISSDYDADYKPSYLVRTQRLSLIPKTPQLEGMRIPSPDVDPHKMSLIKLLLFKLLGVSNDMDEKGNPLDPYRALFLDGENPRKKMKRAEDDNPYDAFPRAWQHYWQNTVVPMAARADEKIRARMEAPKLWECLEVFNLQKELAIGKYLIPSDDDCFRMLGCQACVKLENRLTVQEYVCYIVRRVVSNLDAYGVGTAEGAETFEPAFEDALDPDIDGEVKLKAGDAPQKHTKFVRDMIAAGLLPLTSDEDALHRAATHKRGSATAPQPRDEQLRLKAKAPMITQTFLDAQRAVMTADTATPPRQCPRQTAASVAAETGQKELEDSAPTAHWRHFMKPSEARLQSLNKAVMVSS